jgi:hypothetical protein
MIRKRWQIVSNDAVWMFPPDVQLSTISTRPEIYEDTPFESCLFYSNGDSNVIARYKTQEEALLGHIELEKKYGLKRCTELKIYTT